jgi:hypothetical protein
VSGIWVSPLEAKCNVCGEKIIFPKVEYPTEAQMVEALSKILDDHICKSSTSPPPDFPDDI